MNLSSDSVPISYLKRVMSPAALYLLSVMLPLAALGYAFKFSAPPLLPLPAVQQPLPEPEQESAQDGYTRLSVLSLFTPAPRKKPAVQQQDDSDEQMLRAPESTLPVKVTGLLSSNIDSRSIAIVQHNKQQLTLGVGDALPDTTATIVRIFPQRVIIRHRGKFEALTMK
ncbi:type II secretion system protein N [Erwinia pyrifoliae]|nr:type II secretion system protein N [Erwinia pyrifoliae]AUX73657.1 general secretion pathway protein GspC [Erwinia pyrifoliae]MCA8876032.1 general secretion pathway protein GspC [Erwinia pyrifoliae]CAX54549.1 General secretion pathway protein C (Pectic enzymes secretion protein OutC) [Erwinia pyrifoliae Ep1/96]CAY73192.1 Type II secretion system protein outC [Erwinia pyrifoliae DSM 12163]